MPPKNQKSDKYLLLKFNREFTQVCEMLMESDKDQKSLNYLQFKEFLVHMGMLSEQQASLDCRESKLIYEMWLSLLALRGKEDSVFIDDLRVFLMAVLRLNDGKHFVAESDKAVPNQHGFVGSDQRLNFTAEQCR